MQPKTVTVLFLLVPTCIFFLISCAGSSQTPEVSPAELSQATETDAEEATEAALVTDSQVPAGLDMYIEITDIYFEKGKASINADAEAALLDKAEWLRENPGVRILLEGHTDEPGTAEYNLAFGLRRAGAVKSFLIKQGIDRTRMAVVSFGRERPTTTSDDENEKAANRRVHFAIDHLQ